MAEEQKKKKRNRDEDKVTGEHPGYLGHDHKKSYKCGRQMTIVNWRPLFVVVNSSIPTIWYVEKATDLFAPAEEAKKSQSGGHRFLEVPPDWKVKDGELTLEQEGQLCDEHAFEDDDDLFGGYTASSDLTRNIIDAFRDELAEKGNKSATGPDKP